ncbi:MAG: hypothetical protein KGN30_01985, partial [Nitrospirota bacterium]|nr:hypothetical protein [Nitrospirota bacterium]
MAKRQSVTHGLLQSNPYWTNTSAMQDIPRTSIDPEERISRYLLNSRLFNSKTGNISPQAFAPANPKKEGDPRKTSIYRTEGLHETEVWSLGDEYVSKLHPENLPILARADMQAQKVFDADLTFDPNGIPHQRHA